MIGFNKNQIKEILKNSNENFYEDYSSTNKAYNYLKFLNFSGSRTLLVFFDENDISSNIRLICDYSDKEDIIVKYDSLYEKKDTAAWEYEINNERYSINMEEKDYYFVIHINPKSD